MLRSITSTRSTNGRRSERPPRTKRKPTVRSPTRRVAPLKISASFGVETQSRRLTVMTSRTKTSTSAPTDDDADAGHGSLPFASLPSDQASHVHADGAPGLRRAPRRPPPGSSPPRPVKLAPVAAVDHLKLADLRAGDARDGGLDDLLAGAAST